MMFICVSACVCFPIMCVCMYTHVCVHACIYICDKHVRMYKYILRMCVGVCTMCVRMQRTIWGIKFCNVYKFSWISW